MKEITPSNKPDMRILVDDEDYEIANEVNWTAVLDSTSKKVWYATACNKEPDGKWRNYRMHRLFLGALVGETVDHINGNGLDNRRSNLRICTIQENIRNSPKRKNHTDAGSKFKGVRFDKCTRGKKKWSVKIRDNNKQEVWVGRFLTEEIAALAYNGAAKIFYGEYARLNIL